MKIVVVCPAGIGTSLVIKLWLSEVLQEEGLDAVIETGEPLTISGTDCDLIVGTQHFVETLDQKTKAPVIGITSVTNKEEYRQKIVPLVRQFHGEK